MRTYAYYLSIAAISIFTTSGALAIEEGHDDCGGGNKIHVSKMGVVGEADLHSHIIWAKDRLRDMRGHSPHGAWNRTESRAHLIDMQAAMKQLHDQMYEGGCTGAIHGATQESRVKVLEKRISRM